MNRFILVAYHYKVNKMEQKLTNTKNRESNIELLRIVLMLMIIMHHLIVHGCDLSFISTGDYQKTNKDALFLFLNTFSIIAVNCFIFISGFYGIKFKVKTLIAFVLQALFYSVSLYLLKCVIDDNPISYPELRKSFFPITYVNWWFLNAYIALFILSPVINKGLENITKKQTIVLITLLFIIGGGYPLVGYNFYTQDGYSFFNLLIVYIIARYCHRYITEIKGILPIYLSVFLISFIIIYLCFNQNRQLLTWRLMAYNCIWIIAAAALFFYLFKKIKIKSKLINKIAPLTFGIYLLHDSGIIKITIMTFIKSMNGKIDNNFTMLGILLLTTLIVFSICACIEKTRQIIFKPVLSYISKKIESYQTDT